MRYDLHLQSATPSQMLQIRQTALRQIMSEWEEELFLIMQEVKELREKSECWREPMDPGKKSDKLTFCIKLETLPPSLNEIEGGSQPNGRAD